MHSNKDDNFFVGVHDPTSVRKNLLMCSKDLINGLKNVEKINDLASQRASEIDFFKQNMSELSNILKKLKTALPKAHIHRFPVKRSAQTVLKKPSSNQTRNPITRGIRSSSKIDKLEAEIAKIEAKLGELE